jgi:RHH-type rel operon transcriptional repressor/antitoxin RelB
MLVIRLDEQLACSCKAIENYLDDMEDYYLAAEAMALSRKKGAKPLSSEEVRLELGLDD